MKLANFILCVVIMQNTTLPAIPGTPQTDSKSANKNNAPKDLDEIQRLGPDEVGKLHAYDVLFAELKEEAKQASSLKKIDARIAFLLKQPFRDLLYEVNAWHDEGVREPAFINAVKEVQGKFGEKVDGDLTFSQLQRLLKIANVYKTSKNVYVGDDFGVLSHSDWARVSGTLEIVGEQIAEPINYHSMELDRKSKICRDSHYYVQNNDGLNGYYVYQFVTFYEIVSWDEDEIICKKDYSCRSEKILINLKSKAVDIITTNLEGGVGCKDLPKLKSPRVSRLVDPSGVNRSLEKSNHEMTHPFISEDAKQRLKELFQGARK